MKRRPFAREEELAIVAAFQSGKTLREAGEPFGRSEGVVCGLLKKLKIPLRGKWKPRMYSLNEEYFSRIDSKEKAYWLGFISADGNVQKRGRVQLALAETDSTHVEKFCLAVGFNGPIRHLPPRTLSRHGKTYLTDGAARVVINSLKMMNDLLSQGVMPAKSLILSPWQASTSELERAWWCGYIDGDGTISMARQESGRLNPVVSCAGTSEVIEAFIRFVERNVTSRIMKRGKTPRWHNGIYIVQYKGVLLAQQLVRLLYHDMPVFLDRKKALADAILAIPTRETCDLKSLDRDTLLRAKAEGGTWREAAAILGVHYPSIYQAIRRTGLSSRQPRGKSFSCYSRETLLEARSRLGSWKAAAEELGIPVGSIADLRRYFGIA